MEKQLEYINYRGYKYWYEYRLAKDRIDPCLATKDPKKYCNGFYLYSTKDPGNGKAFVVIKTNNPNFSGCMDYFNYGCVMDVELIKEKDSYKKRT